MKRLRVVMLVLLMVMGMLGVAFADKGNKGDKGDRGNSNGVLSVSFTENSFGNASIWTDKVAYRVGENVRIGFKSTIDGYAAIYDYPTSGPGEMIWPRNGSPAPIEAGRTYSVPNGQFSMTASEPLGTDRLVLVVSRAKTNLTITIDLGFFFGGGSRGLTTSGQATVSNLSANGKSIYAECSFRVTQKYSRPLLRIYGSAGARLFVDGNDYGQLSGGMLNLNAGTHEIVALLPGMKAESKTMYLRDNVIYDWSLRFRPVR